LIAALGSDKAGMVRTVDDLDRRGFVRRVQSPKDRRLYHLSLTDAGLQSYADARKLADTAAREVFAGLTAAEQAALGDLLSRVARPPEPTRSESSR
jgi:DNA-binding MarR family transcriptional regulator